MWALLVSSVSHGFGLRINLPNLKPFMQKRFQATLESIGTGPVRTVAHVPFDPTEVWPGNAPVRSLLHVQGTIRSANRTARDAEGFPFRNAMISKWQGRHLLVVNQKMQKGGKVAAGHLAEFVIEPEPDQDKATVPPELAKLFKSERDVRKFYESLNFSIRKYISNVITDSKSAETRARRAEQWVERLMLVMEGEEFPPPILQIAFRRQPLARQGWDAMTANQRRLTLLGISMCKSPEAQAKRVQYALEEAMKAANRTARKKHESKIKE
jgi:uncharacterized protein YdeI (YjbR/CyaY-like superfamily)